jgi:hypothetical protein
LRVTSRGLGDVYKRQALQSMRVMEAFVYGNNELE